MGILIGGVGGALLLGLFAILTKASGLHGLGNFAYLITVGITVLVIGLVGALTQGSISEQFTLKGMGVGVLAAASWAVAMLLITLALTRFATPVSVLTPIFNTNTLVAVLLGLWVFAEYKQVQMAPLLLGASLITVGGILVSRA
ncbi:hypothetical protein [Aliagarivorans marinus]|uniref:hypothetical protein n=1 Tax=Aliagarivorans marinus TaxID=561965 RepID=UPI0004096345|nr:hypothetical protein [Aliagarivorans marinus]